jgi:hypothetical protein
MCIRRHPPSHLSHALDLDTSHKWHGNFPRRREHRAPIRVKYVCQWRSIQLPYWALRLPPPRHDVDERTAADHWMWTSAKAMPSRLETTRPAGLR